MEQLMPIILELVTAILVLITTVGIGAAIGFINKNTTKKQQDIIEQIVHSAVLFAQQTGFDKVGQEKFELAKERALEILKRNKRISISEEELETIIEAVVKQAKKEFGENW